MFGIVYSLLCHLEMLSFSSGTVSAFAYKNRKKRFFVPSRNNKFNGILIDDVMMDSGCGSLLLPLKENQLYDLVNIFPAPKYVWKITESKGVSGSSAILSIETITGQITVNLACDISQCSFNTNVFRFHICTDDLAIIEELVLKINIHNIDIINKYKNSRIDRRKHALIGQVLFDTTSGLSIQTRNVFIFYSNVTDISKINDDISLLMGNTDKYVANYGKDTFNDLEDEDHDVLDEEDDIYHGDLIDEESF